MENFQNSRNEKTMKENKKEIDNKDTKVSKIGINEAEEFASKIMDDEDCIYMIHGTGNFINGKHKKDKNEENKYEYTEETLELGQEGLRCFFDEGLYVQHTLNSTAINLDEQAKSNKGANRFAESMGLPKRRPETGKGILADYMINGYEKYPMKKLMILLAIPKKCFSGELPLYEYDEEGKVFAGITGNACDFHNKIPKEYIKGAIIRNSDLEATYFFENSAYDKNKGEKETQQKTIVNENAIENIKKQMEWFYKGQTMLTVQDINEYCTEQGLDFNYEMGQARERVELRKEIDQTDLTTSDKKLSLMMDLSGKAKKIGLDIESEIEESIQRKLLRKEIKDFLDGKLDISIDEINNRCNSLKLNFNYEMENAKMLPIGTDTKNCVKNIATGTLARDVRTSSSEIKNNYNELEKPVIATEDKSINE